MPGPATLLILATAMPLLAAILLTAVGRRLGAPLAGWASAAFLCLSFAFAIWAMVAWYDPQGGHYMGRNWTMGEQPILMTIPWLPIGRGVQQDHAGYLDIGIYLDSLTIAMFAMITLVGALVHIYSTGYQPANRGYSGFFVCLAFLTFAVMGVMLSGTLLQLLIFWELMGLGTFLLISGYGETATSSKSALASLITPRLADIGLIIGIAILTIHLGNLSFPKIWAALANASEGLPVHLENGRTLPPGLLTLTGILLACGALGSAAQFPFHTWLKNSTDAPAPVAAMIQAIAHLAVGAYLLARLFPILTPQARLAIAIIGLATLVIGALCALAQTDVYRLLAYATLSQAGLIVFAIAIGSWGGGLFHLIMHAFFKSLLVLAAGSVLIGMHRRASFSQLGGLWRKTPWTALAFAIGVAAAVGVPWLSGYYSRTSIVIDAGATSTLATRFLNRSAWYWLLFAIPIGAEYLSAFYLTRCWLLIFAGKARDPDVYGSARESPILWAPLIILAGVSIFAGSMLGAPNLLRASAQESNAITTEFHQHDALDPIGNTAGLFQMWPAPPPARTARAPESAEGLAEAPAADFTPAAWAHDHGEALAATWPVKWGWLIGIGLAVALFPFERILAASIRKFAPLRWIAIWLERGMMIEEFYEIVIVRVTMVCSMLLSGMDRYLIDRGQNLISRGLRLIAWTRSRITF